MDGEFLKILFGHNTWATRVLIDDAAKLTDEQFHQRFAIGLGSLHDTLRHIVGCMLRWADRIGGRSLRESIENDGRMYRAAELRALLEHGDAELRSVCRELDAAGRWGEIMEFPNPPGPAFRFRRATAMMHVVTHGMHHRAQVLNIRRQLGLPPLGLDLDAVEWECVQTGQIQPW